MEAGQFVKWEAEDFSHIGMIITTGERTLIATEIGEMSFSTDDGVLTPIRRPKNFHFFNGLAAEAADRDKPKPTKAAKPGSKKARALKLYADTKDSLADLDAREARLAVIEMFVDTLDMTPAGASTYYAMVKKAG